jgi:hypothetical protein
MTDSWHCDSFNSLNFNKEHNMIVRSVALDADDANALQRATAFFPGVSPHLAHLALLRLGLQLAQKTPALLGAELRLIGDRRRERARDRRRGQSVQGVRGGNHG